MFEVIVQSQPNDCQSLEILKEAYTKLGREEDVDQHLQTHCPGLHADRDSFRRRFWNMKRCCSAGRRCGRAGGAQANRGQGEQRGGAVRRRGAGGVGVGAQSDTAKLRKKARAAAAEIDDGRKTMHKIFVESKIISAGDFDLCWRTPDLTAAPPDVVEPFIQMLHEKGIFPVEKSLKLLSDKSRTAFLPLERYDVDIDLMRGFPAEVCRRWCVLPFDRMSKSILVATANPFNQQAAKELAEATSHRLLWYLAPPAELMSNLRKAFR